MILTGITEKNEAYFDEAVGSFWKEAKANDVFLGFVDDDDNAVGAAVLEADEADLNIKYFGIADEFRGKGYGRYFMDEIAGNTDFINRITCTILKKEDEENEFLEFLKHVGFETQNIAGRRCIYDMSKVVENVPEDADSNSNTMIIAPTRISDFLKTTIFELADKAREEGNSFDADLFLSESNIYGGALLKGREISAMLTCTPFLDGVRVAGIYANNGAIDDVVELLERASKLVKKSPDAPAKLYVDTAGSSIMRFEDKILGSKGIRPEAVLNAVVAVRGIR